MSVYEILPGKDGHWVASVGQGQAVSYRVDITPDRKVTVTKTNVDEGGSPTSDGEGSASVTVDPGKPLEEMTKEELVRLIQDAASELETR